MLFALFAATMAYTVTHWAFPPVGFEGMIVLSGPSFLLWAVSAAVATLLCAILFFRNHVRTVWPLVWSAAAATILFIA